MVKRCTNPNHRAFKWYGAIGIHFDPRWQKFESFLQDMGEAPEGMTLERKRVKEGYNKDNCCWIPKSRQAANKSTSLRFEIDGITKCLKDWCRDFDVNYMLVYKRIRRGWSFNEAIQKDKSHANS